MIWRVNGCAWFSPSSPTMSRQTVCDTFQLCVSLDEAAKKVWQWSSAKTSGVIQAVQTRAAVPVRMVAKIMVAKPMCVFRGKRAGASTGSFYGAQGDNIDTRTTRSTFVGDAAPANGGARTGVTEQIDEQLGCRHCSCSKMEFLLFKSSMQSVLRSALQIVKLIGGAVHRQHIHFTTNCGLH